MGWGYELQKTGSRQNDIGVAGGVGREHLLNNYEQVFTGQSGQYLAGLRRHHGRVGQIDIKQFDWRIVQSGQGVAQFNHVDSPRSGRAQIRSCQTAQVGGRTTQCAGDPSTRLIKSSNQGGQQGDGPHRHGPFELAGRSPSSSDVGCPGPSITLICLRR